MAIRKFVILVPGHGGTDPGAHGQGTNEATETKQIVTKAAALFAPHPNITVVTTPFENDFVADTNWINANYKNLDDGVIVEVHKNSFAGTATGIETFTGLGPDDTTVRLATLVNNGIVAETGLRNRGVKQGNFYLITATNQRAILAECGFIGTDGVDDATDAKYARGIYNGVCDFFGESRNASPTPAPAPQPVPVPVPTPVPTPTPTPVVVPPVVAAPLPCGQPSYTEADRIRDNKTANVVTLLWDAIKKMLNIK